MNIIIASFFNDSENGGWAKVANSLAEKLYKNGHNVMLVCPGEKTILSGKLDSFKTFRIGSYLNKDVAISNFSALKIRKIYRTFDNFKPDIIHSHGVDNIGMLVQNYCILAKKPNVLTPHILLAESTQYFGPKKTRTNSFQKVTSFFIREYLKKTDGIVSLTSEMLKHIEKYKYKGSVREIPNAIDLDRFIDLRIQDKFNSQNLINIGHISARKNQGFLIESMDHIPNYKLSLVGKTMDEDYAKEINEKVPDELKKSINFTGAVDYSEVPKLLEGSKVYVTSSKSEVQSLAILEALASGTPVVALGESSTKSWVPDCVRVVDENAKPNEFAQFVNELLNLNKKDYENLCVTSRKSVLKHSWDNVIDETVKFYIDVINEYRKKHSSKNIIRGNFDSIRRNSKYRILFVVISNLLLVAIIIGKISQKIKKNSAK